MDSGKLQFTSETEGIERTNEADTALNGKVCASNSVHSQYVQASLRPRKTVPEVEPFSVSHSSQ